MTVDEYRRQAIEAEREAGRTIDAHQKSSLSTIAKHWRSLAEQLEWLESRLGLATVADVRQGYAVQPLAQQQQQIQPEKEE